MGTFTSSVWDRLLEPVHASEGPRRPTRLSQAQYKRAIARDLEVLLNTRVAIRAEDLGVGGLRFQHWSCGFGSRGWAQRLGGIELLAHPEIGTELRAHDRRP